MLAMSTVLRREEPFRSIFGYALVFAEDGRQMHKSWGNAIEFDEAADRMGVDVMRWMFANARPQDNILFGWHAADEARRELLVLWNVYAFFVTYARLAGWHPGDPAPPVGERPTLDRWILSRLAGLAARVQDRLGDYDPDAAASAVSGFIDELSTWYLRRTRRRFSRAGESTDRAAAFATLHAVLVGLVRVTAPLLPFLSEAIHQNLVVRGGVAGPDSVHLAQWPSEELAGHRDVGLEGAMATAQRAVELVRTLRAQAGIRTRQPLARLWIAIPRGDRPELDALLELVAEEVNVHEVVRIDDESALIERRVKPLLPKIGRKLGPAIPAVMAAARDGRFEILPDGSVALGGVVLAPEEVEILAAPRPGTAVAHDDGLVVVIDTELTDALRAEGDARELQRAVQDLRRDAGLELDDRIDLVVALPDGAAGVRLHLPAVAAETLADAVAEGPLPDGWARATVALSDVEAAIALRRREGAAS
jgi:isoleucyl-tRNA synthetase